MGFCPNDKSCCVLGDVCDYVKGKPQVPKVWPIFNGIRLIHMEVTSLGVIWLNVHLLMFMVGI
jgi:hypothetical protein